MKKLKSLSIKIITNINYIDNVAISNISSIKYNKIYNIDDLSNEEDFSSRYVDFKLSR